MQPEPPLSSVNARFWTLAAGICSLSASFQVNSVSKVLGCVEVSVLCCTSTPNWIKKTFYLWKMCCAWLCFHLTRWIKAHVVEGEVDLNAVVPSIWYKIFDTRAVSCCICHMRSLVLSFFTLVEIAVPMIPCAVASYFDCSGIIKFHCGH